MKKRLTSTAIALVAIGALMSIMDVYFNTFLVARFYELVSNSTELIARYYILVYSSIAGTFLIIGNWSKNKSKLVLRLGIILNAVVLTLIMILDENVIKYCNVIAIIFGIAQGCYYSPFSNLVGTNTSDENGSIIKEYYTVSTIAINIVSIVFPITIGTYLNVASFTEMSRFILVLIAVQIMTTFKIRDAKTQSIKYDMKKFIQQIRNNDNGKKVITFYKISFCNGIVSSVLDRTITILILMLYKTTFNLGILSTIFAVSSIVITWAVRHFYQERRIKITVIISAIVPTIAVILLALNVNSVTFIVYKLVSAIFICVLNTLTGYARYESLDKKTFSNFDAEHQCLSELSLAAGRVLGFCALLICSKIFVGIEALKIFLVIIGAVIIVNARYVYKTIN